MPTLAIDFGTSNSAVALAHPGGVWRLPIEGHDTVPTAVFFPEQGGAMRIGNAAARALAAGDEGRYMRALKSVLGLPLLHEPRLIAGRRRTLAEVVTAFLATLRTSATAATGQTFTRVLSGRPVHFHDQPERDARAEADLRACYQAAGFTEIAFLPEPEAAMLACHHSGGGLGLVVDIGGGTSDFTLFRHQAPRPRILASHGIRLGGTDFDTALSLAHAMPLLGLGGALRREMGSALLPVPRALYVDLATWARIPFLYAPEPRRQAAAMARLAVDGRAMARLCTVLEDELGHTLAFAVEAAKIAANDAGAGTIAMATIEPGLGVAIRRADIDDVLASQCAALQAAAAETLARAGVRADAVDEVILVGGSSRMRMVGAAMRALCPTASLRGVDALTAVVDGLAIAAARG